MGDNISVGIKIHDSHHGLVQVTGAVVESEFAFLKELGAAIQIATIIKDHETIKDVNSLYAAAGELKIPRALSQIGLEHLEKLDFVRLKYATGKKAISRVDIVVPGLSKIYNDFGQYFQAESESAIANSTIKILDKLSAFPHKEKEIVSELGLSPRDRDLIIDVSKKASLISSYNSPTDRESVLYSPLYWDDNPSKIFDLLKKHKSADFLKVIEQIQKYQGLPDGKLDNEIVSDAITLGCLPSMSVSSSSGLKKFIFTPRQGVGKIEKELLNKARTLISCVRYGENFAGITKINSPERLINALARRGYLNPHTESLKQYEPARNLGLVKIVPSVGGRYEVHFIDNEENKRVVDMAIEMIEVGETSKFDNTEENAKKILMPGGGILHPTQTRTHVLEERPIERSANTVQTINELLRGIE